MNINYASYKGIKYSYDKNKLFLQLSDSSTLELKDINYFINKFHSDYVEIYNITNSKILEALFKLIKKVDNNININVNLNKHNLINGLNNKMYLNLKDFEDNVTISAMSPYNNQNEFITWAHNLNQINKLRFIKMLPSKEKIQFINQEKVIRLFYNEILLMYPNIKKMPKKDQFKLIFDYVKNNYTLAPESYRIRGEFEEEYSWAKDPVQIYIRGIGLEEGRANLLTLLTNNSYFRLNCTIAEGHLNEKKHVWNQFIDEEGNIYDYDMSFDNDIEENKSKYRYSKVYPCITENKNKKVLKNIK